MKYVINTEFIMIWSIVFYGVTTDIAHVLIHIHCIDSKSETPGKRQGQTMFSTFFRTTLDRIGSAISLVAIWFVLALTHLPLCRIYASEIWVSSDSGIGLSPVRRQAITWTNADLLSIGPLGTNFSEISVDIQTFSLNKIHLKMASAIFPPNCPGGDVLI